ncbi:Syntaxin 6 N-terminal family protein [Cryptosporidium meleagridis]|uniref:Syntaxin 6 N-terminal family protein n=1 Tax=Cryptosporidium meleagridis TaxID=93969 RepID=A0A2P4YX56_9CRYT|nr:Syntaxin 6 N-terminal family protein [Cryptosporidium meleagridis]
MQGKDPYYKAFSELENISENIIQQCKDYKEKIHKISNYSENKEIESLYERINLEIESFEEMYNVLDNIINNVKKNPGKFIEINKDEINNREKKLKEKYEIMINCKEEARLTYRHAKEKEIQNQRRINRDFLLNNHASINNYNLENEFHNIEISNKDENLEYIHQNTRKLHNAALIISQELNEQNNLIEGMVYEVEEENIKLNFVFDKMMKQIGISSKLKIQY